MEKRTIEYQNGDVYEGETFGPTPLGTGIYRWKNGDVYEGDWLLGERTGKGTLRFASGGCYEGDFQQGKRTGNGRFTWPNGDRYEGDFADGKRHGQGTMHYANGSVYSGNWEAGTPQGLGQLVYPDGGVYHGHFRGYVRHGWGKYTWPNGSVYKGNFENDKRTGQGTYRWTNGDRYKGGFLDGKLHGAGIYYYANGGVKWGEWENDRYVADSGESLPPRGRWEDYVELYDLSLELDDALTVKAYNDLFRRLRARGEGHAHDIVFRKIGMDSLSNLCPGDARVCKFILDRFVPRGANPELVARCFYLTEQYAKAAGVVAMKIEDKTIRQYANQNITTHEGLAMEILAARCLKKAEHISRTQNACQMTGGYVYGWPYIAKEKVLEAVCYLVQSSYSPAVFQREKLAALSLKLNSWFEELIESGEYKEKW